jgi:thiamine phosphate synthase YjbQ (UPF0047 family)
LLEPQQGGNITQQIYNHADRRVMKDGQQIAGQIVEEGQANTHKKNNVDNPAQHRAMSLSADGR